MSDVVPSRLFFSRLPGGELEFSAIALFAPAPAGATISWTLTAADGSVNSLSGQRRLHDNELSKGTAVISAMVPPGWPDSTLAIDAGSGVSVHDVHRYHQVQAFVLPFDSDVLVVGGHRIGEPHRMAFDLPTQQFAWDLLPLSQGGLAVFNSQMSQPPRSADFACYGRAVLSPADGTVVAVVDGIPDAELLGEQQLPEGASIAWAAGNHVIIRHDDQVHSCLAHLKAGSVTVAPGMQIKARDPVGAVGSSGNVTGPHLHLHFMNGPDLITAAPLPIELTAEGETLAPVSGQIIGP